jgi:hypothetical protein
MKIDKELYGYLIHYTIYFYFTHGRKPKSIKEFYSWFVKNFRNLGLLEKYLKNKNSKKELLKILRIWFYKITTKNFDKLLNSLKNIFHQAEEKYHLTPEDLNKICKVEFEKTFIITIPKLDKRIKNIENKTNITFKIKKFVPDILIECFEPLNTIIVIELKSGNRKLWKKYRKQIKEYILGISQLQKYKNYKIFGMLYYFKNDTLVLVKFDKENKKFEFIKI